MENIELLKQSIQELISKYELKINNLEVLVDDCTKIKNFLDNYNNQNYDLNILSEISEFSIFSDEIKQIRELIKAESSLKDYVFLKSQYNENHKKLEDMIKKLDTKYKTTIINISKNKIDKDEFDFYKKVYAVIGKDGLTDICTLDVINFLIDKVHMLNISDEEKEQLVVKIIQSNVNLMKKKIELEVKKNNSTKDFLSLIKIEPSIEKKNVFADYKSCIDSARNIVANQEIIDNEEVTLLNVKLKKCETFSDREKLYSTIDDFSIIKSVIVKDIKENLLGNINENNYQLLISVIDYYNAVCERERLINYVNATPIYELLSNEGFIKELELIKKSEDLYQIYNEFIGNYYKFDMNTEDLASIQNASSKLSNEIDFLENAIREFIKNGKKDNEFVEVGYDCLLEKYELAITLCDKIKNAKERSNDSVENQSSDMENLLDKNNKSILIFIPSDESDVSTLEKELLEDIDHKYESFDIIRGGLNYLMKTGEMTAEDHRAKSDNYSEEFKRRYRLKGYKWCNYRIITTRRNSSLGQVLNGFPENIFVNIIFSAGYGNLGGNQKSEVYEKGFKICYDNKEKIDEILRLINIKWDNLPDSKKQEELNKLKQIFADSQRMYNHFLDTCKMMGEDTKGGMKQ